LAIVAAIRACRLQSVQTEVQYVFVHRALTAFMLKSAIRVR